MPQKQPPARIAFSVVMMRSRCRWRARTACEGAIALALEVVERDEAQRRGVDAVAKAALPRPDRRGTHGRGDCPRAPSGPRSGA